MPLAVIVPASPALVPAISGRTPELDHVRAAAGVAVRRLVASRPRRVMVVAEASHDADETAAIDLRGYGLPPAADPARSLPAGFASAAWLLDEAGWEGSRSYARPAAVDLVDGDGIIVVADGTACRSERAPGHLDDRAEGVDERLSTALETGDLRVLDELDEGTARELLIGGLSALRWLHDAAEGHDVSADLTYRGAPLGVGLWVASWTWGDPVL